MSPPLSSSSAASSIKKARDLKQGSLFSFFSKKKPAKVEPANATVGRPSSKTEAPPSKAVRIVGGSPSAVPSLPSKKSPSSSFSNIVQANGKEDSKSPPSRPTNSGRFSSNNNNNNNNNNDDDNDNNNNNSLWKGVKVNSRIAVYWQDDRKYYGCLVKKHRPLTANFFLQYDDGEQEWLDLSKERFKLLYDEDGNDEEKEEEEESRPASATNKNAAGGANRRRQILEDDDSEDEQEWQDEMSDDEDGFVFEAPGDDPQDHDDADDDQLMVTDDEDDQQDTERLQRGKRRRAKKAKTTAFPPDKSSSLSLKVTYHGQKEASTSSQKSTIFSSSSTTSSSFTPKATNRTGGGMGEGEGGSIPSRSALKTPLRDFSHIISPRTASSQKQKQKQGSSSPHAAASSAAIANSAAAFASPQPSMPSSSTTPSALTSPSVTPSVVAAVPPLPFVRGVLNPRGAHVHNHLKFLQHPTDSQGRPRHHPQYDARTLRVNPADWNAINGGKMTDGVQQWWDLKAQYFDTVLLFKTGKFYEMFHMDADIGVATLGLIYMKGHVAHAGFPEMSYGSMADRLVRAGYKVARVEQTETPEQLKYRNDTRSKGSKPAKVVNREVCSILTMGTRTFCVLDDESALMNEEFAKDGTTMHVGGCGPLLAIFETLLGGGRDDKHNNDEVGPMQCDDDEDNVQPVCEYGVTLIDAIRGTVTLGQFADDVLRSRMYTLLTAFAPSEILVQGTKNASSNGASPALLSLLRAYQSNSRTPCHIESIQEQETFPKSTALDAEHRRQLERERSVIRPWHVQETIEELHRKRYYPRASRQADNRSIARWPAVLKAVLEGGANLCVSSFGAALFYLQRNLIDHELLSMGNVKAYVPQFSPAIPQSQSPLLTSQSQSSLSMPGQLHPTPSTSLASELDANPLYVNPQTENAAGDTAFAKEITFMSLDGTTLHNLEILTNAVDFKVAGSLWGRINFTKSPHGARMLRAWLLRPLYRKADIDRRADAVQEMVGGAGNLALTEAREVVLSKIGDLDRLLSRVHSMSVGVSNGNNLDDYDGIAPTDYYPNKRAVLYCGPTYTKRKVDDFSKVLNGLKNACQIPDIFGDVDIDQNGLLFKLVRLGKNGGCFPDMMESLDWYFENFDCDKAAIGMFELAPGCDPVYDHACNTIQRIKADLVSYREEICSELRPKHLATSSWKYINTTPDSKDKYLIELPASVEVPLNFFVLGKRGSGLKQVNKYRTLVVEELVQELEQALELREIRKAEGMQLIFARFDAQRSLWEAAAHATAILDALGSLTCLAGNPGYCRPEILESPAGKEPSINIKRGRHPCVEKTYCTSKFIPNDLSLGPNEMNDKHSARLLLLSGPNMGGKSTMLRQTCLIAILSQIGSFVPAECCRLTPIDCIFTRLGASDRIYLGQSTFFVELAETSAALRGATRRSLVIMDELGRGTSTFDGTAIASATVKHLVERCQCLTLFATHYHTLLAEWEHAPNVRLGHMACLVQENENEDITFLYTLGAGSCPKSFGINVAKLAGLPAEVLRNAKRISEEFEDEMNGIGGNQLMSEDHANEYLESVLKMVEVADEYNLVGLWDELQPK